MNSYHMKLVNSLMLHREHKKLLRFDVGKIGSSLLMPNDSNSVLCFNRHKGKLFQNGLSKNNRIAFLPRRAIWLQGKFVFLLYHIICNIRALQFGKSLASHYRIHSEFAWTLKKHDFSWKYSNLKNYSYEKLSVAQLLSDTNKFIFSLKTF